MIPARPSTLAQDGARLAALRGVRAPFVALAVMALLVNLLLPTAVAAATLGERDAFGSPICSGLDTSGERLALVPHCNACQTVTGAVAPAPPMLAHPLRFAAWRAPLHRSATTATPAPMAARRAPRGPPSV